MKKILLILLMILIGIQFIRPEKNSVNSHPQNEISAIINVPVEVQESFKNACYNCHSNTTKYPWYNEIAPVSWILANHIKEGKEHLNFSEWKNYNNKQKNHILDKIEEVLEENKMPLKSYLLLHKEVKLTTIDVNILLNWLHEEKSSSKEYE